jgi:DNA-binding NtrC family response regulator
MKDRILIIDDEQGVLNFLYISLMQTGKFDVTILQDSTKAYQELEHNPFDILLLDMDMPVVTGLEILKHVRKNYPFMETVILTGVDDVKLAVDAMKLGAYDYLTKPVENELLLLVLHKALERRHLIMQIDELKDFRFEDLKNPEAFKDIVTRSPKMIRILHYIEKIGPLKSTVLIWGESGSGKELVARAIHAVSPWRDKKFIAINAGALASELFISEFFGHVRGAFTGAHADKKGFLEEAHEGTLFLDEIGELSHAIQVKLLRVLQEREYFRLGSTQYQKVDTRIIASTNKDLQVEMQRGNFRKDLFYRLNINSIYVPPLREHKEDIPILTYHFLRKYNQIDNKKIRDVSNPVMDLLQEYDYPGNIRELENIVNHMVSVENSSVLNRSSLPQYFLDAFPRHQAKGTFAAKSLEEVEREYIRKVLEFTGGNRTQATKILGISRVNLIHKIKKYKLEDNQSQQRNRTIQRKPAL